MEFREIFENYGGDYDNTMDRFVKQESLYLRLLGMVFEDENLDKLRKALADQNLDAAFEAAHTLKGVVSSMGLEPLSEAVTSILDPLRKRLPDPEYPQKLAAVETEFDRARQLYADLRESQ